MARTITTADTKPKPRPDIVGGHTLSMFVNNKPGVLMRICQIFARRAYNIDSLVVSQGRDPRFSRLTLGISGDPAGLTQIILQCDKLIDVIHCHERQGRCLDPSPQQLRHHRDRPHRQGRDGPRRSGHLIPSLGEAGIRPDLKRPRYPGLFFRLHR